MNINEIIAFINNEFPNEAEDISAAIDLLTETIMHLNDQITSSYNKYSAPKYTDTFNAYRNKSLELYYLVDTLNNYIENLTPDFDMSNVEDEKDDEINKLLDLKDNSSEQRKLLKKLDIDYKDIRLNADTSLPHSLYEDFTHKRPCAFEINGEKIEVSQWRELLSKTCEYLYNCDNGKELFEGFITSPDMNGDLRKYFSHNKNEIAEPQIIGDSDIYVIGNVSAIFVRNLIIRLLNKFKIPKKNYNILIQRDLSSLHIKDDVVEKIEREITEVKDIAIDSELKIGQYAKAILTNIFKSPISEAELVNMQNKEWSHETLGICYPLLKKYIKGVPNKQQRTYGNQYNRYYKRTVTVNGEEYFLCSQWFEEFRPKLDKWIVSRNDKNIVITHYYKIKHNTYSIILEEELLKILLNAFLQDINTNSVLNVRRIRTKYENIIAQNTKYKTTPQTVLYCLIGKLADMNVLKLAPNCQNGKYVLKDNNAFNQILDDFNLIAEQQL